MLARHIQGLVPLQLHQGTIQSTDSELHIIRSLCMGVSAGSMPVQLSSMCQQAKPPAWAVEASKGMFLDLHAPSASSDAVMDLGEVRYIPHQSQHGFTALVHMPHPWYPLVHANAPTQRSVSPLLPSASTCLAAYYVVRFRHIAIVGLRLSAGDV
jgi:hypothetical protein